MAKKFKYERISEWLKEKITTGEFSVGQKLPTTQELADEFDVSVITANKALSILASDGLVHRAPGVGTVVIAPPENNLPFQNGNGHSNLIGAIVFDIAHPFWSGAIRGIEETCRLHGYNLLVGNDDGDLEKAKAYIQSFISRGVEGLIFVPIGRKDKESYETENKKVLTSIEEAGIPYVLMHRHLESYMAPVSQIENAYSAYEATRLLLKQGVKNPICISHYHSQVTLERERGFKNALRKAGFDDVKERIYRLHPAGQTVDVRQMHEVEQLMEAQPDVDGIFSVAADMLAVVMHVMRQSPLWSQAKVISFDFNQELFQHKNIIAMLDTPSSKMGSQSAQYLLDCLLNQETSKMQSFIFPQFHIKQEYEGSLDEQGYLVKKHVQLHQWS